MPYPVEKNSPSGPLPETAFGYLRVSTMKQDSSLEAQQPAIEQYCAARGLELRGFFIDEGVSGKVAFRERREGRECFAALAAGEAKHLVVTRLDRLGRSVIDLYGTVMALRPMGVDVHFLDLAINVASPTGELIFGIMGAAAQFERRLIAERVQFGVDAKRARGEICGHVPFGWDSVETGRQTAKGVPIRLQVDNPREQAVIRRMAAWRSAGDSFHAIARRLNGEGVRTKRGHRWQCGTVAGVLANKGVRELLAHEASQAQAA
jgi:site-specific DNA recombinase